MGNCLPLLNDVSKSLILDPTVGDFKKHLRSAFKASSDEESTLFIIYIGHGTFVGKDFYLLPFDAESTPDPDTGIHLVNQVADLYKKYSGLDGLVVLLDTCYAGYAAEGASGKWTSDLDGQLRFELLAASGSHQAADGCFTSSVIRALRNGMPSIPRQYLRCEELWSVAAKSCPDQKPQHPTFNSDDGLYVGRNRPTLMRNIPWIDSIASSQVERFTISFEPTSQLETIVKTSHAQRIVIVEGDPGSGKSALSAALAYPDVTDGVVPPLFVQAVIFLDETTTPEMLARRLAVQLAISVPNFEAAQESAKVNSDKDTLARLDSLRRNVFIPLTLINSIHPIRIVFDGFDSLEVVSRESLVSILMEMSQSLPLAHVHLVVTSRPNVIESIAGEARVTLGDVDEIHLSRYCGRRNISAGFQPAIIAQASGNWLVAKLISDLVSRNPQLKPGEISGDLGRLYDSIMEDLGFGDESLWLDFKPVLEVLASAAIGPSLPIRLCCEASAILGGPDRPFSVRNKLARIRPLIVRSAPGTDEERCGLFHQTLAQYLLGGGHRFSVGKKEAHLALAHAIAKLAPVEYQTINQSDPVYRYAVAAEVEHLWASDQLDQLYGSLKNREIHSLPEALDRWRLWSARIQDKLGAEHRDTLASRTRIAQLTGELGNVEQACEQLLRLHGECEAALGANDRLTLQVRNDFAYFLAEVGKGKEALALFVELLADMQRILGPNHEQTFETRSNVAYWTGECGNPSEACRLLGLLIQDQGSVIPRDEVAILVTRNNMAHWTGESGNVQKALALYEELLKDQLVVLGGDNEDTLLTRQNIALWKLEAGLPLEALRLSEALLSDRTRVLGKDHPHTLMTRIAIAMLLSEVGDHERSLDLLYKLLYDMQRVHGKDHPETLATRTRIAKVTAEAGRIDKAIGLFDDVLSDQERILGPDHRFTLQTREKLATVTGDYVDANHAIELLEDLLAARQKLLAEDNPDTLRCRKYIARYTSRAGRKVEALKLYSDLLSDQLQVLGLDHPDTLESRREKVCLEHEQGLNPDARNALSEVLQDYERILGSAHLATIETRQRLTSWQ